MLINRLKVNFVQINLLLIIFCVGNSFADSKFNAKIAVVDIDSVFEHSTAIINVKKSINQMADEIQENFLSQKRDLKKYEEYLIKKRNTITEDEFQKLVKDFNKKVALVQKEMRNKKNSLEQAHQNALRKIHETMIVIIREMSNKHNFNTVLPSTQVLFVTHEMNITLEVISILNNRLKIVELDIL